MNNIFLGSIRTLGVWFLLILVSCTSNNTTQPNDTATKTISNSANTSNSEENTINKNEVDDAWVLIPGKSAGLTKINENAEVVYNRLGKPDGGDAAMQKALAIWFTDHDSTKHSTAIFIERDAGNDPISRVKQIRITSPSFQTRAGIHTGSTLKEIEAAYPVQKGETYADAGTQQYRVYDSKEGIAFEMRPDGSCVAIVIHEAGVLNGGTTYLKFRTTNKFINKL